MTDYRNNHYVPKWYQRRFLPRDGREQKFHYLDLRPDKIRSGNKVYTRSALLRWGPPRCFRERDLYTFHFGGLTSTEVERHFFGLVDQEGRHAVEYFANFQHPSVDGDALQDLMRYLSVQKLRTPKGLAYLSDVVGKRSKRELLAALLELQHLHGAIWTESIWALADATESPTKFIVSDHPVTVYNCACFPASKHCRGHLDPDNGLSATHTIFPLRLDRVLILTNLSWVRNPYGDPLAPRPNPNPFRSAMFNFQQIQTGRQLSETEVCEINFVIKSRALRYIAAAEEEWLYPEERVPTQHWDRLGSGYLFMPDPRSVTFSSGIVMGFTDGQRAAYDEYGRRPGQPGFRSDSQASGEWYTFLAHQGEFARVFGPQRRGRSFEFGRLSDEVDSDDFHKYHLQLESKYKHVTRSNRKRRRKRR